MKKRDTNLKLKAAIVEAGKTLEILAKEIGTSQPTLSRKINGLQDFNESEIVAISKAVNKPITEIFFTKDVTQLITSA